MVYVHALVHFSLDLVFYGLAVIGKKGDKHLHFVFRHSIATRHPVDNLFCYYTGADYFGIRLLPILIFKGLRAFEDENGVAAKAIKLIKAGISVMSFHTRLDCVAGGVNDALANSLGLENIESFEGDGSPMGRVGELAEPMPLYSFAALVKEALGAPFVSFSDAGREVKRVAVLGGSGKDFVGPASFVGADTFVSGELGHHTLTDEPDVVRGALNLVEAGHFYTEQPVCSALRAMIAEADSTIVCDIMNSNPIKTV